MSGLLTVVRSAYSNPLFRAAGASALALSAGLAANEKVKENFPPKAMPLPNPPQGKVVVGQFGSSMQVAHEINENLIKNQNLRDLYFTPAMPQYDYVTHSYASANKNKDGSGPAHSYIYADRYPDQVGDIERNEGDEDGVPQVFLYKPLTVKYQKEAGIVLEALSVTKENDASALGAYRRFADYVIERLS